MVRKEHIKEILNLYVDKNIYLPLTIINTRADGLDEEIITLLKKARCPSIALGVESAHPEVFRQIGKGETLEDIRRAAELIKKHKISLYLCFIIGLPGDTLENVRYSINFAKELKADHIYWNMIAPYKGARVREWYDQHGKVFDVINYSSWVDGDFMCDEPCAESADFSIEERKKAYLMAILETSDVRLKIRHIPRLIPYVIKYGLYREFFYWLPNRIKKDFMLFISLVRQVVRILREKGGKRIKQESSSLFKRKDIEMRTNEHIFQSFLKNMAVSEALWRFVELDLLSRMLSEIRPPILDLGCGNGVVSSHLFEEVEIGVDMNSNAVKTAQNLNLYESLIIADARDLPFSDNAFNTVFCNCTLEHIPNVEKCIKEVNRVLREEGRFIITVPSEFFKDLLLLPFKYYIRMRNKHLSHVNLFNLKNWKSLLNECGFDVEQSEVYLSPSIMKLWDLLDVGYHLRILGISPIGFLWNKVSKNHFISSNLFKILQKEKRLNRGGGRLIIAKKRQLK